MPDEETTNIEAPDEAEPVAEAETDTEAEATQNFTAADGTVYRDGEPVEGPFVGPLQEFDGDGVSTFKAADGTVIELSLDEIEHGNLEVVTTQAQESDESITDAGESDETTGEAPEYRCVVHDRPMSPNPVGSRQRWDCGGNPGDGNVCMPA